MSLKSSKKKGRKKRSRAIEASNDNDRDIYIDIRSLKGGDSHFINECLETYSKISSFRSEERYTRSDGFNIKFDVAFDAPTMTTLFSFESELLKTDDFLIVQSADKYTKSSHPQYATPIISKTFFLPENDSLIASTQILAEFKSTQQMYPESVAYKIPESQPQDLQSKKNIENINNFTYRLLMPKVLEQDGETLFFKKQDDVYAQLKIFYQYADALYDYQKKFNKVHGDAHLANIRFNKDGSEYALIDFGTSYKAGNDCLNGPLFAAPEQLSNNEFANKLRKECSSPSSPEISDEFRGKYHKNTDVFSLGCHLLLIYLNKYYETSSKLFKKFKIDYSNKNSTEKNSAADADDVDSFNLWNDIITDCNMKYDAIHELLAELNKKENKDQVKEKEKEKDKPQIGAKFLTLITHSLKRDPSKRTSLLYLKRGIGSVLKNIDYKTHLPKSKIYRSKGWKHLKTLKEKIKSPQFTPSPKCNDEKKEPINKALGEMRSEKVTLSQFWTQYNAINKQTTQPKKSNQISRVLNESAFFSNHALTLGLCVISPVFTAIYLSQYVKRAVSKVKKHGISGLSTNKFFTSDRRLAMRKLSSLRKTHAPILDISSEKDLRAGVKLLT